MTATNQNGRRRWRLQISTVMLVVIIVALTLKLLTDHLRHITEMRSAELRAAAALTQAEAARAMAEANAAIASEDLQVSISQAKAQGRDPQQNRQGGAPVARNESFTGLLIPARIALVKANMAGRVVKVHVQKGDRVRAGDLLADLNNTVASAELEVARAKFKSAQSRHLAAATVAKEAVDESDAKIKLNLATADLHAAEAECGAAQHRLADTKIRAIRRIDLAGFHRDQREG